MSTHARLPWYLALGFCGCLLVFVAIDQSYWWSTDPEYSFGFLAPLFCSYIVWARWPRIRLSLDAAQAPGAPKLFGIPGLFLSSCAFALLVFGGLAFVLGSLMRADSVVAIPAATFTLTVGAILTSFGLLFLCIPGPSVTSAASGLVKDSRIAVLSHFIFPLGIWLLSARLLHAVEDGVSLFLQGKVVAFVSMIFDLAGATLIREGNVLLLPTGRVGVAEACSGIRSLTGCLFCGAFLGALFFRRLTPKVLLLLAAFLLAFLTNLLRNLFLTFLAYRHGPAAIHGSVHDITGYAVLGLTTVGLLLLVSLLKRIGEIRIGFGKSAVHFRGSLNRR